jgi:hypothetical protein
MDWGTVHPVHANDLVSNLDDVFGFCRDLGLGVLVDTGRFAEYRKRIVQLVVLMQPDERGIAEKVPRRSSMAVPRIQVP